MDFDKVDFKRIVLNMKFEDLLFIIILTVAILYIIYNIYLFYQNNRTENVIHEHCFHSCNGDNLSCDINRCKAISGSACSTSDDCVYGLKCIDWKCKNIEGSPEENEEISKDVPGENEDIVKKKISWSDEV